MVLQTLWHRISCGMEREMKQAEKLKRIKLISEELFIHEVFVRSDKSLIGSDSVKEAANVSIIIAKIFVDEFEKFENEFLKEHEVKNERAKDN